MLDTLCRIFAMYACDDFCQNFSTTPTAAMLSESWDEHTIHLVNLVTVLVNLLANPLRNPVDAISGDGQ